MASTRNIFESWQKKSERRCFGSSANRQNRAKTSIGLTCDRFLVWRVMPLATESASPVGCREKGF
jgi:hypothetical protein